MSGSVLSAALATRACAGLALSEGVCFAKQAVSRAGNNQDYKTRGMQIDCSPLDVQGRKFVTNWEYPLSYAMTRPIRSRSRETDSRLRRPPSAPHPDVVRSASLSVGTLGGWWCVERMPRVGAAGWWASRL